MKVNCNRSSRDDLNDVTQLQTCIHVAYRLFLLLAYSCHRGQSELNPGAKYEALINIVLDPVYLINAARVPWTKSGIKTIS